MKNIIKKTIANNIYNKLFKQVYIVYKGKKIRNKNYIFRYAYVCFSTGNRYLDLINGTIFSVHIFSIYPIILYISGNISSHMIEMFNNYDNLLVVSIPAEDRKVYFMKLRVSLIAPVLVGQIVESDTIVLPGADCLFKKIEKEISTNYPFPMMTRHTDIRSPIKGNGTINILKYPMKKRTMRYMHAHMSWTYNSLPFIAYIYNKSYIYSYGSDEYALNINLWEKKATKQWCIFDPLFDYVDIDNDKYIFKIPNQTIMFFNFIHGCKSTTIQTKLLSKLLKINIFKYKLIYAINNTIIYTKGCSIDKSIMLVTKKEKCLI